MGRGRRLTDRGPTKNVLTLGTLVEEGEGDEATFISYDYGTLLVLNSLLALLPEV
jgi:hypothetical protein